MAVSRARVRKALLIVHLWTGLGLGLWFALMGLTGSVVAWRFEISAWEWRTRFPLRAHAAGEPTIPVSRAFEIAKRSFPDLPARALSSVRVPRGDMPVYVFPAGQRHGVFYIAGVDPYSGQAYPAQPLANLITWIEELHTDLQLGDLGNVACGVLAFFAVFLLVSGLWLWWPRNRKQLRLRLRVERGRSLARTLGDLHNVMGIYLYAVLFVTTLTTVHLVAAKFFAKKPPRPTASRPPGRPNARRGGGGPPYRGPKVVPGGKVWPLDILVETARHANPGDEMVEVALPARPEQALRVMVRQPYGLTRYANLYVDPYRNALVERTPTFNTEGDDLLLGVSKGLHYGAYAGPWSKAVYTVAGLMPTGLLATGFLMWVRKKRRPIRSEA